MIVDQLANARLYAGLSPRIKDALEYLCAQDLAALEVGTYPLGEGLQVRVLRYDSRPHEKGVWEAHRHAIDLQYIVEGEEYVKYAPLDTLTPDALGVDVAPRLTTLRVAEPAKRVAGVKVADVGELVAKLKNEAKVI